VDNLLQAREIAVVHVSFHEVWTWHLGRDPGPQGTRREMG